MTHPPLGNLHPFVTAIADHHPPALSFLNPQFTDLAAWRAAAREQALALLRYAPPRVPLDPHMIEVVDKGDYVREKVTFASAPWSRVPAYVLVPKGLVRPAPGIVALHDHGGYYVHGKEKLVETERESSHLIAYRESGYGGRAFAGALARRGHVVIVIDAFYWGERRLDLQQMPDELVKEMQRRAQFKTGVPGVNEIYSHLEEPMMRHLLAAGTTWMGILSHDDRASVDYLLSRPEVDPERIGCLGLSMGGMRTNWLFGTDPRVKAAVAVGWMTDWRELIAGHVGRHSFAQYVPGLTGQLELSDVAAMGMPGALMVQQCAQDALFPLDGMQKTCDRLAALYAKAGLSERFACRFYDAPHQFNVEMQEEAFGWLERWLAR
ncbi:MAG: prolyl oligopeptidase family serine peptidase [Anaerolineae bacterium]|nr:prolyl oligopeptidase family serine peptidase [Anaerolineae bacterium]